MSTTKKRVEHKNHSEYTQYRVMRRGLSPQYYIEYREPGESKWVAQREYTASWGFNSTAYYYTLEEAQAVLLADAKSDQLARQEPEVVWEYPAPAANK